MTDRHNRVWEAVVLASILVVAVVATMWVRRGDPQRRPPPPPTPAAGAPDAAEWDTLVDLAGQWQFRIGDDRTWAADDVAEGASATGWSRVAVPGAWENSGFHGYDGFAWYRTAFILSGDTGQRALDGPAYLLLGRIDDADEVWVNGTLVGSAGRMPPSYATGLFGFRVYRVPPDILRQGANTLAVRVYDGGLEGGILEGPLALAVPTPQNPASAEMVADLAGGWRFRLGDDPDYADPALDDSGWERLRVPGTWEAQGFDYDGTAWARTAVDLSAEEARQELLLVLGAVDDLDQTFVNGVLIGATGNLESRGISGDEWQRERAYRVPSGLLGAGRNVIAVRIYDAYLDGGIYRGPVGLMSEKAYASRAEVDGRG